MSRRHRADKREILRRPQVAGTFRRGRRVDDDALQNHARVHHPYFEGVIAGRRDLVLAAEESGVVANRLLPVAVAIRGVVALRDDS